MCSSLHLQCSWSICSKWTGEWLEMFLPGSTVHAIWIATGRSSWKSDVRSHWCNPETAGQGLLSHNSNKETKLKVGYELQGEQRVSPQGHLCPNSHGRNLGGATSFLSCVFLTRDMRRWGQESSPHASKSDIHIFPMANSSCSNF